jgi:hypothetical protein
LSWFKKEKPPEPPEPILTLEEQAFVDKCNVIARRLGFGSINSLGPGGMAMVFIEANGFVKPEQNDALRKYMRR